MLRPSRFAMPTRREACRAFIIKWVALPYVTLSAGFQLRFPAKMDFQKNILKDIFENL